MGKSLLQVYEKLVHLSQSKAKILLMTDSGISSNKKNLKKKKIAFQQSYF